MFEREGHLLGIPFNLDMMNLECLDDGKYVPLLVVDSTTNCNHIIWKLFPVLPNGEIDVENPVEL